MLNDCKKVPLICTVCEHEVDSAEIEHHDCLQTLLQKKKQSAILTHKYTSQKSDVVCKSGHPLGLSFSGLTISCNSCKTTTKSPEGYLNCRKPDCNFNLCQQCMLLKPISCKK